MIIGYEVSVLVDCVFLVRDANVIDSRTSVDDTQSLFQKVQELYDRLRTEYGTHSPTQPRNYKGETINV